MKFLYLLILISYPSLSVSEKVEDRKVQEQLKEKNIDKNKEKQQEQEEKEKEIKGRDASTGASSGR